MRKLVKYTAIIFSTFFITFTAIIGFHAESLPDLEPWHYMSFADDDITNGHFSSFSEYLQVEKQYLNDIYGTLAKKSKQKFTKYTISSITSPIIEENNLNASFIIQAKGSDFKGGVLLVHGLSDSPYHIRKIGEFLSDAGFYVIGLRLPGHGTIPAALIDIHWQDWYQAVDFGAMFVRKKIKAEGKGAFIMGGFSTGGALIMHYTLQRILENNDSLPDKLLFFSPAFGITPLAELTSWHKMISWIPFFYKFKWQDIKLEYDPFRYNSWPFNAGYQIYSLANINWELINKIEKEDKYLKKIPSMIAFQSRVDATVIPEKVYELFDKIAPNNSKLVLFDVNRQLKPIISEKTLNWNIESISGSRVRQMVDIIPDITSEDSLENRWPESIYAISHVCVPISQDDAFYGKNSIIGGFNIKGENGVLETDLNMGRLKYNPYFPFMKREVLKFIEK